mmetsp:Transcript_9448/g.9166  ORF Transcript_9448/g.9166 Transcript_9448/m.9166 type:complete len:86 (-) Transcript_9448:1381-1638(-)
MNTTASTYIIQRHLTASDGNSLKLVMQDLYPQYVDIMKKNLVYGKVGYRRSHHVTSFGGAYRVVFKEIATSVIQIESKYPTIDAV